MGCRVTEYSIRVAVEQPSARADNRIGAVRLIKTRSIVSDACWGEHIRVNEVRERIVAVFQIITKRVGAAVATKRSIDKSPGVGEAASINPTGSPDLQLTGASASEERDRLARLPPGIPLPPVQTPAQRWPMGRSLLRSQYRPSNNHIRPVDRETGRRSTRALLKRVPQVRILPGALT
ncbi:hypothetical protein GCM10009733_108730 [Nonomuraea maheshkhaliensis]|uniref:Uncharacterized protein n=1 Tax=Nonomuraea maheshkhaliensis TaxID=419590 RepID=A0ABP4TYY3_9ACTN